MKITIKIIGCIGFVALLPLLLLMIWCDSLYWLKWICTDMVLIGAMYLLDTANDENE